MTLSRGLGAFFFTLLASPVLAQSVAGPVSLAPAADCQSTANVSWSFTYTVNPAREFGRITNATGTTIGSYDQPSTLTGGSFTGAWTQPITLPQPPNTVIGTYGGAGDAALNPANTAEFFLLYSCTTREVLYRCTGNLGSCPTTTVQALAVMSSAIPVMSPAALGALLLLLMGTGAARLLALQRRTRKASNRRAV
ncbi:MAG TPA: hypothetical protein VNE58_08020 [Casimicrobiaceae bacterium]|nr:hypothetical protein [Casimicrobiaceae bacterium]